MHSQHEIWHLAKSYWPFCRGVWLEFHSFSWNSTAFLKLHSFPGIPPLPTPPQQQLNPEHCNSEHTLSLWAEAGCDLTLIPSVPPTAPQHPPIPTPTLENQSFHTWFLQWFWYFSRSCLPLFLLKVSVVNFGTQLPNCGFWKTHKFPDETTTLDWNRREGIPCCGLLLLKYPAGSLKAAPAQMWGINNIFQTSLWTRKIQLAFALLPFLRGHFLQSILYSSFPLAL